MADNDPNHVWPSGLTTREAEELHDGLKQGTRIFGAIAVVAHILAFMNTPWLHQKILTWNEGKIWTVVKPSVGVPLFLGAVVVMVFTVHFAILTHTTWFAAYWQGGHRSGVATVTAPAVQTAPAAAMPTPAAPTTTP